MHHTHCWPCMLSWDHRPSRGPWWVQGEGPSVLTLWQGPLPPLRRQNWKLTLTQCSAAQLQLGAQNRGIIMEPRAGRSQPVTLNRPGGTASCHRRAGANLTMPVWQAAGRVTVSSSRNTTGAVAGSHEEWGRASGLQLPLSLVTKN